MALHRYEDYRPKTIGKYIIEKANIILADWHSQGYDLTVRQLYYQFVARDWFPGSWVDPATGSTNNQKSYEKMGRIVSRARKAGMIDWKYLVDLGRVPKKAGEWDNITDLVETAIRAYRKDRWVGQQYHVEVAAEKDAATSIVNPIAHKWHIAYTANKGYTSSSAMYQMAQRMREAAAIFDKIPVLIYVGDHDPSGCHMSVDLADRMREMFGEQQSLNDWHGGFEYDDMPYALNNMIVDRVALNMDQIQQYEPPVNPVKDTDSRSPAYVAEHGEDCWELDALRPDVLTDLVETAILKYLDKGKFEAVIKEEVEDKKRLEELLEKF
jgi:hypothetical protein